MDLLIGLKFIACTFLIAFAIAVPILLVRFGVDTLKALLSSLITSIRNAPIRRAGLDDIDDMDGYDFEVWLEHLFRRAGYKVRRTRYYDDGGADLVLTRKDGTKVAVQAKKLTHNNVGVKAISEVLRGREVYGCQEAWVVTNQGYTRQAQQQAPKCGVKLIDREDLSQLVNRIEEYERREDNTTGTKRR